MKFIVWSPPSAFSLGPLGGSELLVLVILFGLPLLAVVAGLVIYQVRRRNAPPSKADIIAAKLAELQEMKTRGLITEDEFKAKRKEIIDAI